MLGASTHFHRLTANQPLTKLQGKGLTRQSCDAFWFLTRSTDGPHCCPGTLPGSGFQAPVPIQWRGWDVRLATLSGRRPHLPRAVKVGNGTAKTFSVALKPPPSRTNFTTCGKEGPFMGNVCTPSKFRRHPAVSPICLWRGTSVDSKAPHARPAPVKRCRAG